MLCAAGPWPRAGAAPWAEPLKFLLSHPRAGASRRPLPPQLPERGPCEPPLLSLPRACQAEGSEDGPTQPGRSCPPGSPGPPAPGPQTRGAHRPRGSVGTGNFPAARPAARSVLRLMTGSRGPGGGAGGGFRAGEAGPAGPVLGSQAAAGPVSSTRNFCFPLRGAGRKNNN